MARIVEIRGLEELRTRFKEYPKELDAIMQTVTQAQLLTLPENVPPYPPKPQSSTYSRTGTLAKRLGSTMGGGASGGQADIFQTIKGAGFYEARFGTNLFYAGPVIGNPQASFFAQYWWKFDEIIGFAFQKILQITEDAAKQMANFLKGKGL